MASVSYMPAGLLPFKDWLTNFQLQAGDDGTDFGISSTDLTALAGQQTSFNTKLAASTSPDTRTPVTVAATNTAFNLVRGTVMICVASMQASGLITEAVATRYGITFRKTTKTPITAPTETPSLDVEAITPLAVTLRVRQLGAELSALPPNVIGYQVRCEIDPPTPPISPDSLHLVAVGTRRFWSTVFGAGDVGKQVFFSVRYVTAKQLYGPWSNIVATTIVSG